jgi:hypothetical protein
MTSTINMDIPHDPAGRARQQQFRALAKEIASGSFLVDAIARWTEQVVAVAVEAEREKRKAAEAALDEVKRACGLDSAETALRRIVKVVESVRPGNPWRYGTDTEPKPREVVAPDCPSHKPDPMGR